MIRFGPHMRPTECFASGHKIGEGHPPPLAQSPPQHSSTLIDRESQTGIEKYGRK